MFALANDPAAAQSATSRARSSADSVRLVADLFFRAVADERWEVAAAMVDTTLVRHMVSQRLRWRGQTPPQVDRLTIEDFLRDDPAKPRAVAEYELKRYREQMARVDEDFVSREFAGVKTLTDLARLSSLEATSRYLQAQDLRVQMREAARRAGCGDSTNRGPITFHRILGVAVSADTAAFVLHEDGVFPGEAERTIPRLDPMVMQLRLRRGTWRILPTMTLLRAAGSAIMAVQCDSSSRRPAS
jgi:hypothetical protein